jgi:hypothetical protein
VRTVQLSNHPGDALAREQARRATLARIQELHEAREEAWRQRRWRAWFRGWLALGAITVAGLLRPGPAKTDSSQEAKLAAGVRGENLVAGELASQFDDEWTLLRGYRNRRGEIDQLLLGPAGIVAIEIKHRNATISCDGDEWSFEKYDRYGNCVERGRVVDRGGRSPSRQLNESADQLHEFLRRRGQSLTIERVVVLTHPRSALGSCEGNTVHITTDSGYIATLLNGSGPTLDPTRRAEIERLIVQDHAYHEKNRSRRSR